MRIRSKAEFFELSKAGCLGNTLRYFETTTEALESNVQHFGLREIGIAGGGHHQVVNRYTLVETARIWALSRDFSIDEAAPDTDVQLQGEVCRPAAFHGEWRGYLGIQTSHRMRESIQLGLLRPYSGLTVPTLLRRFLDPSSFDDVENLLEIYPEATIELAAFPYSLGKIPGRNTVIWEVRNY